ncbi:riboflavin synthase [Poriferisphaera sp. WC338]|uniref:riboflavin synthase n=1 Tax=Poriferisphaera sp. WC338 TaxID=3425129 RepID=UPI003D816318
MFTGIVQAKGVVKDIQTNSFGKRLIIDRTAWNPPNDYKPGQGESICCSGVCLTVVDWTDTTLSFDVIAETLEVSKLGDLTIGSEINLEPAVFPNQPLGGHFMQGHVDGVGTITDIYKGDDEVRVTVAPPQDILPYIVYKGSIAIDGISLTIASVDTENKSFAVALIPETLEVTTLGTAAVDDRVNLEADIITKTVVHNLQLLNPPKSAKPKSELTHQLLKDAGFLGS